MSDHEADATSQSAASNATAAFSSNGHQPGGPAVATEGVVDSNVDDGNSFLAELARAMQSTAAAEQTRNAENTEQRRQTHIDAIRAREALEAEQLRELAKEDVKGIDGWSDGEIKRVKLERERRIAARREQLQIRLEEHRTVVGREVEAVEAAVAAYKADIEQYFRRLDAETDPVVIAKQAGTRPTFPTLELIGPADAPGAPGATDYRSPISDAPAIAEAELENASEETVAPEAQASAEADEPATEQPTGNELIGVMDPDVAVASTEAPWDAGTETEQPVEAESTEETVAESESTEAADESEEAPEPVGAVAEARVVMPRPTGAGSWLRWPNSSPDHTDGGQ